MNATKKAVTVMLRLAISLSLSLLLAVGLARQGSAFAKGGQTLYRVGEVVVGLNIASGATVDTINATYGTSVIEAFTAIQGVYHLRAPANVDAKALAEQMALDVRLDFAEPNWMGQSPEADPARSRAWGGFDATPYSNQYVSGLLNLSQVQAMSSGAGVVVAVLDTGIQAAHPTVAASLQPGGYDFVADDNDPSDEFNGADDDGDGLVDEAAGHGTHVAGIIHMVAPAAKILPLRVLDSDGAGDFFALAKAIDYARQQGAQVINMSLGAATQSELLNDAIELATRAGVVVVAAAGNANVSDKQFPAADNCVISVASTGANDTKSSYSNFGSWVSVAAPGEGIYSAFPVDGYAWWSGTSMATPFVSAQAALLRAKQPALTALDVSSLIAATTQSIDAQNQTYAGKLGAGRIDVMASLTQLLSGNIPAPSHGGISASCL